MTEEEALAEAAKKLRQYAEITAKCNGDWASFEKMALQQLTAAAEEKKDD